MCNLIIFFVLLLNSYRQNVKNHKIIDNSLRVAIILGLFNEYSLYKLKLRSKPKNSQNFNLKNTRKLKNC